VQIEALIAAGKVLSTRIVRTVINGTNLLDDQSTTLEMTLN